MKWPPGLDEKVYPLNITYNQSRTDSMAKPWIFFTNSIRRCAINVVYTQKIWPDQYFDVKLGQPDYTLKQCETGLDVSGDSAQQENDLNHFFPIFQSVTELLQSYWLWKI